MPAKQRVYSPLILSLALLTGLSLPLAGQNTPASQVPTLTPAQEQELDKLNKEGSKAYSKGDFPNALAAWQTGLKRAQSLKNDGVISIFLSNIGLAYESLSQFEKALEFHQKALNLREKLSDEQDIAISLDNISNVYGNLGQYDKAFDFAQRALKLRENAGNEQDLARSLTSTGNVYNNLGLFEEALNFHQRALKLLEKIDNKQYIAVSLNNIGGAYNSLGQFEKALEFHQKALQIDENLGYQQGIARSFISIGNVYAQQGLLDKALDFHQRALKLFQEVGYEPDVARSLTSIGYVYSSLGQYDKALDFQQKALKLREKLGNEQDMAENINNIGNVYARQGQFDQALSFYQKALAAEKIGIEQDFSARYNNIGYIFHALGQYHKALECYAQALKIDEKFANEQGIACSFNNMVNSYLCLNDFEKGLDFLMKALNLREKLGNEQDTACSLNNIGLAYYCLGQFEKALDYYARAVHKLESVSLQVGDPARLSDLQEIHPHLYERYALTLHHLKRPSEALLTLERGRGQGLARQSKLNDTDLSFLFQPEEAKELKQRTDDLTRYENLLHVAQRNLEAAGKPEQRAFFQKTITEYKPKVAQAEQQYQLLRDALFARYPRFKELRVVEPPTNAQMLALGRRNPDTLYVQWGIASDTETLLVALDKTGIQTFLLPVGEKELNRQIQAWRVLLTSSDEPEHRKEEAQQAKQLFSVLFAPLIKAGTLDVQKVHHIVLVGSGSVLDAPLAALMNDGGKRLVERFAVSTALSFGILYKSDSYRDPTASFFCVADPLGEKPTKEELQIAYQRAGTGPLPSARKEGQALTQLFPNPKLLLGTEAKEATIRKAIGNYALLHFATHGYLESKDPLHSGLILAKEPEGSAFDGLLTGKKIQTMTLAAQLAVLSACDTGRGQVKAGEGLQGLAWAFRAAGCPAIVASHWKVDDATTRTLMVAFYKALKAGKRKDEALQAAMLAVKKDNPAPYHWAAFQIIGDTSPIHLPKM